MVFTYIIKQRTLYHNFIWHHQYYFTLKKGRNVALPILFSPCISPFRWGWCTNGLVPLSKGKTMLALDEEGGWDGNSDFFLPTPGYTKNIMVED